MFGLCTVLSCCFWLAVHSAARFRWLPRAAAWSGLKSETQIYLATCFPALGNALVTCCMALFALIEILNDPAAANDCAGWLYGSHPITMRRLDETLSRTVAFRNVP